MTGTELASLEVLAFDCQATAPDPARGHLLEVGWAISEGGGAASRLVQLPEGVALPERVRRVTGISNEELARAATPGAVWRDVADAASIVAARNGTASCPTVVHFASYEERHLRWLRYRAAPDGPFPFRFLCTHRIASRLLPELPRKSLRAVAGYFGHGLSEARRAAEHAVATRAIWRALLGRLREQERVTSLEDLIDWLREPRRRATARRYPMPEGAGRELSPRPGVYCMLRANGDVLYVGKATALRDRVSSYFRPKAPHAGHILEMLSQARDIAVTETASALEAALLESDEIKRLDPPYNRALRRGGRRLVFASRELEHLSETADEEHRVGPLLASEALTAFAHLRAALAGERAAPSHVVLGLPERFAPEPESFASGLERFQTALDGCALLAHGARLWPVEEEAEDEEEAFQLEPEPGRPGPRPLGAEAVAERLGDVARRAAHLVRRAHWHALLAESSLAWRSRDGRRSAVVIEAGQLAGRETLGDDEPPPCPPESARPFSERRRRFDLERYDRMTVLTREMRRLVAEGREPALRLGPREIVEAPRLERLLRWV